MISRSAIRKKLEKISISRSWLFQKYYSTGRLFFILNEITKKISSQYIPRQETGYNSPEKNSTSQYSFEQPFLALTESIQLNMSLRRQVCLQICITINSHTSLGRKKIWFPYARAKYIMKITDFCSTNISINTTKAIIKISRDQQIASCDKIHVTRPWLIPK